MLHAFYDTVTSAIRPRDQHGHAHHSDMHAQMMHKAKMEAKMEAYSDFLEAQQDLAKSKMMQKMFGGSANPFGSPSPSASANNIVGGKVIRSLYGFSVGNIIF